MSKSKVDMIRRPEGLEVSALTEEEKKVRFLERMSCLFGAANILGMTTSHAVGSPGRSLVGHSEMTNLDDGQGISLLRKSSSLLLEDGPEVSSGRVGVGEMDGEFAGRAGVDEEVGEGECACGWEGEWEGCHGC